MAWRAFTSRFRKTIPRIPPGRRIYAVGDIHGCADLLTTLLGRIDEDLKVHPIAHSTEVFLGDYIDRGPDSRRVLDLLIARRQQHETNFLKGNHDEFVAKVLSDPSLLSQWSQIGGVNTLLSYGVKPSRRVDSLDDQRNVASAFSLALPDSHSQFLQGLALSFSCGDFFFAHAGVRPGIPLRLQSQGDLLGIRDDFLLYEEDFGKVVVHGHTPTREPDIRSNRINIDTGAYATGRLTCLVLEGDQKRFL